MTNFILFIITTYPPGDRSIRSQAQINIQKRINESENSLGTQHNSPHIKRLSSSPRPSPLPVSASLSSEPEHNSTNEHSIGVESFDLESLIQSGNFILKVRGLREDKDYFPFELSTLNLQLKGDATLDSIMATIKEAGTSLTIVPHVFWPHLRRMI